MREMEKTNTMVDGAECRSDPQDGQRAVTELHQH